VKIVKKTNFYPQPKVDGIVLKFIKKELSETKKNFLYGDFIGRLMDEMIFSEHYYFLFFFL
ncbi:MAG: hypothetical protein Q8761_03310, partial [Sweet potato little leaf phytoplasma]|nr:hypothetical protein [Sweet potato little leaf phytoplasma]